MKALSLLGTSSDSGKSWLNTAFCALLKRHGYRVAPFKAQNMSNNSYVTLEGGEIGRAQAAQAEACGLRPIAEMNPVLLKPSGDSTSQVVLRGKPGPHIKAGNYYLEIERLWEEITAVLEGWKSQCDVLVMEGAGSPVELNLMQRDIVNLRPIDYLDGRWLLACDIERGGVFAQAIGTVQLMPEASRKRGLGLIVNKFRGDPKLFDGAAAHFAKHIDTPYLGVIPMRYDLQPETEDGFMLQEPSKANAAKIAWVALPRVSNTQDAHPWREDTGAACVWVRHAAQLRDADAIVLPGSKNTIHDLLWLRKQGLDEVITAKARAGTPVLGICGGYQMLGEFITDLEGIAGTPGEVAGLGLLPLKTTYSSDKRLSQVTAHWCNSRWQAYEIHMGQTEFTAPHDALLSIEQDGMRSNEGIRKGNVWGTYLHGLFEVAETRNAFAQAAGIKEFSPGIKDWHQHKQQIYSAMADVLEEHLDLSGIFAYLEK